MLAIEMLNVVVLAVQTVITGLAVYFAWLAYTQTREIHRSQQRLTERMGREQFRLAKQQIFYQLVEQIHQIRSIDSRNPHWEDVSTSANQLELIAAIWRDELISRKALTRNFRNLFMRVFEEISQSRDQDTGDERGRTILETDCPTAVQLYKFWKSGGFQDSLETP